LAQHNNHYSLIQIITDMKNHLFAVAALAALTFASCDKDNEQPSPTPVDTDGTCVRITLCEAEGGDTRTFFDTTAAAEAWEKTLTSLCVLAFDDAGSLLVRRDFTSSELTAKSATFALPKSAAGTTCTFYAVANLDVTDVKSAAGVQSLVERSAAAYNGTFAEVSTKAKRPGGFVMSGFKTQTVGAVNSTTAVGITLKRTVAKVALQTTIDPSFAEKYGGTLTIHSVKLSKAASQTLVMAGTPAPGAMTFTHTQTPAAASGKHNSLFYVYENGPLAAGSRVLLEIGATYDMDGNAATADDRSDVTYSVELSGKAAGDILRNGY